MSNQKTPQTVTVSYGNTASAVFDFEPNLTAAQWLGKLGVGTVPAGHSVVINGVRADPSKVMEGPGNIAVTASVSNG